MLFLLLLPANEPLQVEEVRGRAQNNNQHTTTTITTVNTTPVLCCSGIRCGMNNSPLTKKTSTNTINMLADFMFSCAVFLAPSMNMLVLENVRYAIHGHS